MSSCRASRAREAPRERRRAISCRRAVERANKSAASYNGAKHHAKMSTRMKALLNPTWQASDAALRASPLISITVTPVAAVIVVERRPVWSLKYRISPKQPPRLIVLSGFGAGLTWGTALMRW